MRGTVGKQARQEWHGDGATSADPRPLAGTRILDFTWVVAGPVATRILADLGAEVIKVERRDTLDLGDRRGGFTGNLNRGKQSIAIDMNHPRGLAVARALAARSDVVIDNFSARVMRNWGLDYEALRALRPDIIAVSVSGFGLTGPHRDYVSYGPTLQALTGFTLLMAHPGGTPAGFGYSYSDMAGGMLAAVAVLAALWHRRRTGRGQLVDVSQFEALASLLGPLLLDIAVNGRRPAPSGNRSPEAPGAPHGIYRCRGQQRWVAISVFSEAQWERFVEVLGRPPWCADPRFASRQGRVRHQEALDRLVEQWTLGLTAEEVMARLQRAGIAAAVVASAADLCIRDPQLESWGYWARVRTPEGGEVVLDGVPYRLSATPAAVRDPGPLLGEHTETVLRRVLGYGDEEIAALRAEGAVS